MARSRDLRPGYSRRAQYGIFTGYVIAVVGIVVGLVAFGVSLYNPGAFGFARGAASDVAAPVGRPLSPPLPPANKIKTKKRRRDKNEESAVAGRREAAAVATARRRCRRDG